MSNQGSRLKVRLLDYGDETYVSVVDLIYYLAQEEVILRDEIAKPSGDVVFDSSIAGSADALAAMREDLFTLNRKPKS